MFQEPRYCARCTAIPGTGTLPTAKVVYGKALEDERVMIRFALPSLFGLRHLPRTATSS